MNFRRNQLTLAIGALVCALLLSTAVRAQDAKKEHAFKGVVQKVDAKANATDETFRAHKMIWSTARMGRNWDRKGRSI